MRHSLSTLSGNTLTIPILKPFKIHTIISYTRGSYSFCPQYPKHFLKFLEYLYQTHSTGKLGPLFSLLNRIISEKLKNSWYQQFALNWILPQNSNGIIKRISITKLNELLENGWTYPHVHSSLPDYPLHRLL